MKTQIGINALIPNPALKPFEILIGEWKTTGSHPYLQGVVLLGRASFEWLEGGAFLLMRSEIDDPNFPHGIEIFGSDDMEKKFFMLRFDARGISREFNVTVDNNQLKWWRNEPSFSQRYTITIENNGNKLVSKGEMSRDGGTWEKDLELTHIRTNYS